MLKIIMAYFIYSMLLIFMLGSAIWVIKDSRNNGKPWSEALAWGLFCFAFVGLGLIVYIYWNQYTNQ